MSQHRTRKKRVSAVTRLVERGGGGHCLEGGFQSELVRDDAILLSIKSSK